MARCGHKVSRNGMKKSRCRRKIGLLGGSFNPAHDGHRHISLVALKRLELDEVWWLVSPQNPLKSTDCMADFEARLASAERIARHPRILASGFEAEEGLQYTADTLSLIQVRHPDCRFVWLMGADNLGNFHKWDRWLQIADTMPIAVFARPGYDLKALAGVAAHRLRDVRLPECKTRTLINHMPPAWAFLAIRRHPESATRIRKGLQARGKGKTDNIGEESHS